ncbi:MAG: mannose-6-phosphate isomerase [Winogradskyella sp.]|uniref:type I phosphomannose isomerase catalytic subunit n=1 Tax=Winogradskyella sp. TaxID=1883156 RepID=UPI000F3CC7BA|nr:type I phosphomannose isomerase catalytic subunit [Winogradskyella sp.]RNC86504.1 MAG: mannose-6-phosphate isomerase [Winogradskyella sp.]
MEAYPIKFRPILKEKIWGGEKLSKVLNKNTMSKNIGESWEISGVDGNVSVVSNGLYKGKSLNDLIRNFGGDFLGAHNISVYGYKFPLLIKFLDAKSDLSVQVHPDDKMAMTYHDTFGKTEMWYIMESEKDAEIILGLKNNKISKDVLNEISAKNVEKFFNTNKVKEGDSYFIPAGKVHAIGAGVLAAEIQQTSDVTYRVYDWDRIDKVGNKRELHTELAIKATKVFKSNSKVKYHLKHNQTSNLVDCDFFTTNIFEVIESDKRNYDNIDSFKIFMCVDGKAKVTIDGIGEFVSKGETVLIPATCKSVQFNGFSAKFLEIYVNNL